ncbi:MAG: hypothetical protein WA947_07550 [Phormidesmis sp.]
MPTATAGRSARISQNSWDLETVIARDHVIPQRYFDEAPLGVVENFQDLLSRDVFSEGDARSLYNYVMARKTEMSDGFLAMLTLWLQDELKHYEGLRRTYHSLASVSYEAMTRLFSERTHNIEPIKMLLQDEFTLLVAITFDEMGSVYSYRRDLREYYCHFGSEIQKMGHHLVRDEGMHFNNAAELLLSYHAHRLEEVQPLLENISKLEKSLKQYHQAFFLDHAQEQHRFPPQFNQLIIQVILARLGLGDRPNPKALKELWQWTPNGHTLVSARFSTATKLTA